MSALTLSQVETGFRLQKSARPALIPLALLLSAPFALVSHPRRHLAAFSH
jgi:hypothetical protein